MPNPAPKSALAAVPRVRVKAATAISLAGAQAAASQAISLVLYNAAQAEQAGQQVGLAALGTVMTMIASAGKQALQAQ